MKIDLDKPFAFYRLPGERYPRKVVAERTQIRLLGSVKELNGRKGFVMAPFCVGPGAPVVLLEGAEPVECDEWKDAYRPDESVLGADEMTSVPNEAYARCFRHFVEPLRQGIFDKLVLSRCSVLPRKADFDPLAAFEAACRRYVHSYVYLCYTPQTGLWLGSTPEILLAGQSEQWQTVALAGTQPLENGSLPQDWSEKNRKEQAYVTDYIRERLQRLGIEPAERGPFPVYAGALAHLKTEFRFAMTKGQSVGELLDLLHPTPAVCGLPKEEAYRFIREQEGYDRRFYAGFVGWMDPTGRTDLYVNLRCMQVTDTQLSFYAGGGILSASELEDEWMETEKKMQTMKRLLNLK